jgi:hypothetical protein
MPPAPMAPMISYGPRRVPGVCDMPGEYIATRPIVRFFRVFESVSLM